MCGRQGDGTGTGAQVLDRARQTVSVTARNELPCAAAWSTRRTGIVTP
ncbi:hypothetical protein [Cryobacterium cheniae]|nr:hypothetical protein [Cryobacterium cheniae]